MATYLITGANRGIGLEYCRQLKGKGEEVIATCRKDSPELERLGVRIETGVDVSSESSVLSLKKKLEGTHVDSGCIYAGNPARKIKKLDFKKSSNLIDGIANNYLMYSSWFTDEC